MPWTPSRTILGPGNVRELENLIERAVLLSPGKELRIPFAELKSAALATSGGADPSSSFASFTSLTSSTSPTSSISTLEEASASTSSAP